MAHVLDASALTAYFEREPGYEKVQKLLTEAALSDRKLFISAVNWGEVYYVTHRTHGASQANQVAQVIETFPIELVDVDIDIAKQAALFKVSHKLPYADCFAAALAKIHKATLVTTDKDFTLLEGEIKVHWL
jgi:predicted nucleic acid-binding protein